MLIYFIFQNVHVKDYCASYHCDYTDNQEDQQIWTLTLKACLCLNNFGFKQLEKLNPLLPKCCKNYSKEKKECLLNSSTLIKNTKNNLSCQNGHELIESYIFELNENKIHVNDINKKKFFIDKSNSNFCIGPKWDKDYYLDTIDFNQQMVMTLFYCSNGNYVLSNFIIIGTLILMQKYLLN